MLCQDRMAEENGWFVVKPGRDRKAASAASGAMQLRRSVVGVVEASNPAVQRLLAVEIN